MIASDWARLASSCNGRRLLTNTAVFFPARGDPSLSFFSCGLLAKSSGIFFEEGPSHGRQVAWRACRYIMLALLWPSSTPRLRALPPGLIQLSAC